MQPNEIVLAVDEQNDGVGSVNHSFTRFEEHQNRALYIGSTHTLLSRDTVGLYRTLAKPNGNFRGVGKSAIKLSKDYAVTGVDGVAQITAPLIVEISFSVPVGCTAEQALLMRQRAIALLDRDDIMAPLMEQLMI